VIFTGISVLVAVGDSDGVNELLLMPSCQAAKDVGTSRDTLTDLFERIETLFKRLENYTEVPLTYAMTDTIVKIMVEVLGILAIATKEIKQGSASEPILFYRLWLTHWPLDTEKYLKKLIGRTDIEDALKRLDKLTHDEVLMATAATFQVLRLAHTVDDKVTSIDGKVTKIINGVLHSFTSWANQS